MKRESEIPQLNYGILLQQLREVNRTLYKNMCIIYSSIVKNAINDIMYFILQLQVG